MKNGLRKRVIRSLPSAEEAWGARQGEIDELKRLLRAALEQIERTRVALDDCLQKFFK